MNARTTLAVVAFACLGPSCSSDEESASAPETAEGVWTLNSTEASATFVESVDCAGEVINEVSLTVSNGVGTLSLAADGCSVGSMDGDVTEGEDGFIANLSNQYGEESTLTCTGDGPDAFTCEHSWLIGPFRIEQL